MILPPLVFPAFTHIFDGKAVNEPALGVILHLERLGLGKKLKAVKNALAYCITSVKGFISQWPVL